MYYHSLFPDQAAMNRPACVAEASARRVEIPTRVETRNASLCGNEPAMAQNEIRPKIRAGIRQGERAKGERIAVEWSFCLWALPCI
jgi:hypothetical protein